MLRWNVGFWVFAFLIACGDDSSPADAGDAGSEAGGDIALDGMGEDAGEEGGPPPIDELPVDPTFDDDYEGDRSAVVTTLVETFAPRYGFANYVDDRRRSRVPLEEFGATHPQPGEPHLLRDQLALPSGLEAAWTAGALPAGSRSLHFSFVIGDPQFVDQESPSQIAKNATLGFPAVRPHGEFVPAIADGLIRAANLFHDRHSLDMVFAVGDQMENAQRNEMEWFLTILRGGELSTDTGERDDIIPGPNNDAYDPFMAEGLRADVPWVSVIGNHDVLVNGNFPPGLIREVNESPEVLASLDALLSFAGATLPGISTAAMHPALYANADRPAFLITPSTFELDQLPFRANSLTRLGPGPIPADPDREWLDVCDVTAITAAAEGLPPMHGYEADDVAQCETLRDQDPTAPAGGWFSLDLVPGALRLIALSLGPVEGGAEGILARPADGCMAEGAPCRDNPDYDQIAFLEAELARAEADEVALIVMSHQSSEDIVIDPALNSFLPLLGDDPGLLEVWNRWIPTPNEPMDADEFRQRLAASGHVIAHIAGHNHRNQIRAVCADGSFIDEASTRCAAGASGETGYWELTTAAIVDWPHQARFMEVVHVDGRLGGIYLTSQDPRI
ncbi:MAG: hypothetical protein AAF411_06170, partial [Myxococcota bacterium]